MRALLQRVTRASVTVGEEVVARIGTGLVVFVGVGGDDTEADARLLADKLLQLRIFADDAGKFNRSALDTRADILVVSQFTLYADARKGRRPSFTDAAPPALAESLYNRVVELLRASGLTVATGRFAAHMRVELVNDGPVTIWLDSRA
ncbi:MAG: D-aminoacyl-tRNA deacylase [Dehalococcoidia bacterium]|nr:D-aminoacyl-tRNA deacylase [Dehalococcoidia bacterium]